MILDRSKPRGDHRPRGSLQAVGKRVRDSRVVLNKASSRLNRWRARGVRRALRAYLWPNARSAVRTHRHPTVRRTRTLLIRQPPETGRADRPNLVEYF